MSTAMDLLEQTVWDECVHRLAAKDEATVHRWQRDPFAAYREHFRVQPLPAQYDDLLDAALTEWQQREQVFLKRLGRSSEEFDQHFPTIRERFLGSEDEHIPSEGVSWEQLAYGVVRNLDVVNCFACFLPRAVPDRRVELAKLGRRIAAVFYLEQIGKVPKYGREFKGDALAKADATWRYASELMD